MNGSLHWVEDGSPAQLPYRRAQAGVGSLFQGHAIGNNAFRMTVEMVLPKRKERFAQGPHVYFLCVWRQQELDSTPEQGKIARIGQRLASGARQRPGNKLQRAAHAVSG